MVVSVPIHYDRDPDLSTASGDVGAAIHAALSKHYESSHFVRRHTHTHNPDRRHGGVARVDPAPRRPPQVTVVGLGQEAWKEADLLERGAFLRADSLNDTNHLEIFVYCNEVRGHGNEGRRL